MPAFTEISNITFAMVHLHQTTHHEWFISTIQMPLFIEENPHLIDK